MSTISVEEKHNIRAKVAKPLLWLSMVSMTMIFAALTSAYVIRHEKGDWMLFQLPQLFYISTAVIMMSSVSMNWAVASSKKNNYKNVSTASLITLILGIIFIVCQFKAWGFLVEQHIVFAGKYSNASGSFLYALTGLHMAHLVGGIIAIIVVWARSLSKKYDSKNLLGIQLCAIFWHFLDILWIYLFLFLLFFR